MEVTLSLVADDLSPERLQQLTRDLASTLNRETPLEAKAVDAPSPAGARGIEAVVGSLALTFAIEVTREVITALVQEILRSYLARSRALKFVFAQEDKRTHVISAADLEPAREAETIQRLDRFLRGQR